MSLLSGWCWLGRFALDSTLSLLIFGNVHISFLFLGFVEAVYKGQGRRLDVVGVMIVPGNLNRTIFYLNLL